MVVIGLVALSELFGRQGKATDPQVLSDIAFVLAGVIGIVTLILLKTEFVVAVAVNN